jgi:hypothetical protein
MMGKTARRKTDGTRGCDRAIFWAVLAVSLMTVVAPPAAHAGEFGLVIDDAAPFPCTDNVSRSLNTCTSDAVETELRAYFKEGKRPTIEAVRYFLDRCAVHPAGKTEHEKLRKAMIALLTDESVSNTEGLYDIISCFPYRSMRSAINAELKKEHSETIRQRLAKAMSFVRVR